MENLNQLALKPKNPKITSMISLITCLLAVAHPALAVNASWQQDAKSGHLALEKGNPKLAGHFLISALGKVPGGKLRETDAVYRQLVFEFVSDDVLVLCAENSYAEAETVAYRKLASAELLFGPTSLSAIDALHDLAIVYGASKRQELERLMIAEMKWRLKEAIQRYKESEKELTRIAMAKSDRLWARFGPVLDALLKDI